SKTTTALAGERLGRGWCIPLKIQQKPQTTWPGRAPSSLNSMGRHAEEILEFDRLRDLLRGRTTSAPGRRAIEALAFRTERRELEREFSAVAEAISYLRSGEELGFGALADPEAWLERL